MTESDIQVEREVRVQASPETIFPFLTDPERMVEWMGARAEAEPQPGGIYRVDINGTYIARGEYLEVVPPRSVAFTFGWEGEGNEVGPGSSRVDITLTPDGDGTIVRLVQTGLPHDEAASSHDQGWEHYLGRLEVVAAGGDPGPDRMAEQ